MSSVCRHPRVRVVAREDDVEYVECEACGEVFDADEYQEIAREEIAREEGAEPEDGGVEPAKDAPGGEGNGD
jgi:Zn ribbon nucleic-acid-binding protein